MGKKELLRRYQEMGTPDEIQEAFRGIQKLEKMFRKKLKRLRRYEDAGSPQAIESVLAIADLYAELGSIEELTELKETMKRYEHLGTPAEFEKTLELSQQLHQELETWRSKVSLHVPVPRSVLQNWCAQLSAILRITEGTEKTDKNDALSVLVNNVRLRLISAMEDRTDANQGLVVFVRKDTIRNWVRLLKPYSWTEIDTLCDDMLSVLPGYSEDVPTHEVLMPADAESAK